MSFVGLFDDDMIPNAGGLFDDDIPYAGAGVPAGAPRLPGLSLGPNQQTDGERQRGEMSSMALIAPGSGGDGDSAGLNKEEEENDSRSGSEDVEGVSGDDAEQENTRKKKLYYRHTPQQIQELEALFKECEHPNEKQRMELSLEFGSSTSDRDHTWITCAGRSSILKLAQRMTNNFCAGVSPSSAHKWTPLVGTIGEDVTRVMARQSLPGEPPGAVLSAATSVWLPVAPGRLFDFLQDECLRSEWDILSNGGPLQEMAHFARGQDLGNAVSLFRLSNAVSALILQETCTDSFGSLVVYAPVDISTMHLVMNGGDSDYVALLPSGFAIAPDLLPSEFAIAPDGPPSGDKSVGGSLLTVAFQILAKSLPDAMTEESAETMNNLISRTVQKIMAAFHYEN